MEAESFISINVLTALFTLINMILTFLVLKKFLFKPVKKMIDDRQKEIDDMYANAEGKIADAEALKVDYESKLQNAKESSAEIIKNATDAANKRSEEIISEAMHDADAIKTKALHDIELEKKKAINGIKDDISGMAIDIAEKVVEKEINEDDHKALIEDFINNMEG